MQEFLLVAAWDKETHSATSRRSIARMHGHSDMYFQALATSEAGSMKMVGNIMASTSLTLSLIPVLWAQHILSRAPAADMS